MLLTETQVYDEFKLYNLWADGDPLIANMQGLIKNVAFTLSSSFRYLGEKADVDQLYAFPRILSCSSSPVTPQVIYEAQLYILIHDKDDSFLLKSFNRRYDSSFADEANGLYRWKKYRMTAPEIERRIRTMLKEYIVSGDSVTFNVK